MSQAAALKRALARHQGKLEEFYPSTATIAGVPYACSLSEGRIMPTMDAKTMLTSMAQTAIVTIRRAILPVCPATSARVTVNGLDWFIEAIGAQDASSIAWTLHLKRTIKPS